MPAAIYARMNTGRAQELSLRPGSREMKRLAWALGISLALHLVGYGGYELGKKFSLWQYVHWPRWLQPERVLAALVKIPEPRPEQEPPLMFVNVNPVSATPEPPKNAKFYSDKNSEAANPEPDNNTEMPKISGKQTEVVKAEDTPRVNFDKLQPDFAQLQREREAAEQAKPKPAKPPGDLVMAKPDVSLRQEDGFTEHSRPRTIAEALKRQNRTELVGEKMKQDGGVSRNKIVASFDTKATPFGSYDAAFIEAVQSRWYALLDQISYNNYRSGHVLVEFRLHYDGKITDVRTSDSTVGDMLALLCQKAIVDPAPYDPWPTEMRRTMDKDYRDISFNFLYH
jgi:hypothetical protein